MMIVVASDHGGLALKEEVKAYLDEKGVDYIDVGNDSGASCDYAAYGKAAALKVAGGECEKGLLFCGTGIGMAMVANKIKGIRAAVASDIYSVKYTRLHNDANILALGGRVVGGGLALELVETFLTTPFEGGRHQRRIDQIAELEKEW